MNIFAIEGNKNNIDFVKSALALDNFRLSKMSLESCQLMCSALYKNGINHSLYKPTHLNHPCTIWTAESAQNFYNLMEHTNALIKEYYKRFDKNSHACHPILKQCFWIFSKNDSKFPTDKATPFRMAMPIQYQNKDDVVGSYRKYFSHKDNIIYPYNKVPEWFKELRGDKKYKVKMEDDKIREI